MRRLSSLVIAGAAWTTSAWAEPRRLTLEQAVALAVRQNPALAARRAQTAIANGHALAVQGVNDPVIAAAVSHRLSGAQASGVAPPLAPDATGASLTWSQPLSAGGRLALGVEAAHASAHQAGGGSLFTGNPAEPSPLLPFDAKRWSATLQISLEQPLLRGFGKAVARAEQRRADIERALAHATAEAALSQLLRDVVAGYWRVSHAQEELEIRRAASVAARAQLERVQAGVLVGKLPPSATAEIEVETAVRDDAALVAEQGLLERALALGQLCGLPREDSPGAAARLPPLDPGQPGATLEPTLVTALERSPEWLTAHALEQTAGVDLEVAQSGLLPALDLRVAASTFTADAMARARGDLAEGYAALAALTIELPLPGHAAQGAASVALARQHAGALARQSARAQVEAEIASLLGLQRTARRRAAGLASSVRAAALDEEAAQARFEVGRADNFEVLRRQQALASVRSRLLEATLTHLEAQAGLDALAGTLITRYAAAAGQVPP